MFDDMNPKHKLFCQKYVELFCNGTKAYMEVYPDSSYESARRSASELLTNLDIKEYIKYLQDNIEDSSIISIKQAMKWLSEVIQDEQVEKYTYWEDHKMYEGERTADINTKIKAIDTLNKMKGVYSQKVEVQGDMSLNNPFREISTEDIVEMITNEK